MTDKSAESRAAVEDPTEPSAELEHLTARTNWLTEGFTALTDSVTEVTNKLTHSVTELTSRQTESITALTNKLTESIAALTKQLTDSVTALTNKPADSVTAPKNGQTESVPTPTNQLTENVAALLKLVDAKYSWWKIPLPSAISIGAAILALLASVAGSIGMCKLASVTEGGSELAVRSALAARACSGGLGFACLGFLVLMAQLWRTRPDSGGERSYATFLPSLVFVACGAIIVALGLNIVAPARPPIATTENMTASKTKETPSAAHDGAPPLASAGATSAKPPPPAGAAATPVATPVAAPETGAKQVEITAPEDSATQ